jgi:hypothetical protein
MIMKLKEEASAHGGCRANEKELEKYVVGVYSTGITITPYYMKMGQLVRTLKEATYRQHDGDFLTKAKKKKNSMA